MNNNLQYYGLASPSLGASGVVFNGYTAGITPMTGMQPTSAKPIIRNNPTTTTHVEKSKVGEFIDDASKKIGSLLSFGTEKWMQIEEIRLNRAMISAINNGSDVQFTDANGNVVSVVSNKEARQALQNAGTSNLTEGQPAGGNIQYINPPAQVKKDNTLLYVGIGGGVLLLGGLAFLALK